MTVGWIALKFASNVSARTRIAIGMLRTASGSVESHSMPMNAARRIHLLGFGFTLLIALTMLAACGSVLGNENETVVLPTLAEVNPETIRTAEFLTQNAPPPGFESVAYPEIDDNLLTTVYSRFEIIATFEGFYADTREEVEEGFMRMRVWNDEFNRRRQVQLEFLGDVFSADSTDLNIVRIGNNFYMRDASGVCITDPALIRDIATIRAGQIIGGIEFAQPTGQQAVMNGEDAWQYGFDAQFINPPNIQLEDPNAALDYLRGEVWASPEHNVALHYEVTLNVNRAILFFGDRPVTGRLSYVYDVYNIGEPPNISVPNGC
jgi:hypothetical protein